MAFRFPSLGAMRGDGVSGTALMLISSMSVVSVMTIIFFIAGNGFDAVKEVGLADFLIGEVWRPSSGDFGALPLIAGTLLVTIGAMAIAVPLGISCATYISEIAPARCRGILKTAVEMFAAIPSVVYGFLGMALLIPAMRFAFPDQQLFGSSWLAASIVLGIMAVPTIVSVSEDAIRSVPSSYREASLAMGATKWDTTIKVVLPAASSGISTAVILGIGRAIGETMAVLMLTGNSPMIPDPLWNVFSLVSTITGTIALQMPESVSGSLMQSSLFALGAVLMAMTLTVNICARLMIRRAREKATGCIGRRNRASGVVASALKNTRIASVASENKRALAVTMLFATVFSATLMFMSLLTSPLASLLFSISAVSISALLLSLYEGAGPDRRQRIAFGLLALAMYSVVSILVVSTVAIFAKGAPALDWEFLSTSPESGGRAGGIMPAIVGTMELVAGTALIALPLGVLTGVYLNEYAKNTAYTRVVREAIELLNGTPSIIFGMFGMAVFITFLDFGYSLVAGCATLSLMVLPTVIRTTEEALKSVPAGLREASRALGATKWQTIRRVVIPAAMGGIVTGGILSLGRASGETAPVMLTAAVISAPGLAASVFDPVMALPLHLYHLAMDLPGTEGMQYATAAVLLLMMMLVFAAASIMRTYYNRRIKW